MVQRLLRATLAGLLLLLTSTAWASSDSGYAITRGGFTLVIRGYDEDPLRLDTVFRELAQWIWDNRVALQRHKKTFSYHTRGGDNSLLPDPFEKTRKPIPYKDGMAARAIIVDISKRLRIKAKPASDQPASLLVVFTEDRDGKPELRKPENGTIFIGAFPGVPCDIPLSTAKFFKIEKEFGCAGFYWSDQRFKAPAALHIETLPLTQETIRKALMRYE